MAKKIVKNSAELQAAMDTILQEAIEKVKAVMKTTIEEFLQLWYDDYTPSKYPRTYQLLNSCQTTKIEKSGKGYKVRVFIDYSDMHHMSYWDRLDENKEPRPNREKTEEEELKVVRMADGRDINTGRLLPRDKQQRGISGGGLHENVLKNPGKHGVRFWTDAVDTLAGRDSIAYGTKSKISGGNIYDAFEEFLRKKGFSVTRKSSTPDYFMPLLY